jgi:FKBP-type peptidyl-prolyl cis-trans isomerase FklB
MLAAMEKVMAYTRWLVPVFLLLAAYAVQAQGPLAPSPPPKQPPPPPPVKIDKYKLSYAIGYHLGTQLSGGDFPAGVDINVVRKAMEDGYEKRPPAVTKQDMFDQLSGLGEHIRDERPFRNSIASLPTTRARVRIS